MGSKGYSRSDDEGSEVEGRDREIYTRGTTSEVLGINSLERVNVPKSIGER